jgi:DNA excision repair protein ERCC-1
MIKERTDKDYSSVLHAALTSISRVNKTDVQTLRTSFSVSAATHVKALTTPLIACLKSFADIAKVTPSQLQNLPGFGHVKVKRTKEAFENPFRNHATTSIVSSNQTQSRGPAQAHNRSGRRSTPDLTGPKTTVGRLDKIQAGPSRPPNRLPREPSPVWDIELDLDPPLREVDDDTQANRLPLRAERTGEAKHDRTLSSTASSDSDDLYADD